MLHCLTIFDRTWRHLSRCQVLRLAKGKLVVPEAGLRARALRAGLALV